MLKIRNNRDLLTLKVFGYSNLKIFLILALTSFLIGWIILLIINPMTSSWPNIMKRLNQITLEILII